MKTGFIIELEDNGQDFLTFTTDVAGKIIKTEPFQGEAWNGGFIPVEFQLVNEPCMMHKPPHINYGYLKHNVIKITELTDEKCMQQCTSCEKEFDVETMKTDSDTNYFCSECWEELAPVMQKEYEELKANGEIDDDHDSN